MISMNKFNNQKVSIVTGANGGIGFSIVKKFLESGYFVIACINNNSDKLKALLNNENFPIIIEKVDIKNYKETSEFITKVYKNFKKIDILVNSAGIPHGGLLSLTKIDEIKKIFETNFFAQIHLIQLVSKIMRKNKNGYIVNISSVSSFQNEVGNIAYGSSKAALNYATKILAKELGVYGINVNSVAPGVTNTNMLKKMNEKAIQNQLLNSSNNKIAEPYEIASLVDFLSSKNSSHITGQIIKIDGGQ